MPRQKPVKGRRRPLQARSRALVDDIVEAAAQVLRCEGAEAATTNHIAERAGVSIGSIYQYFPDKAALFGELADRHLKTLNAKLEELWPLVHELPVELVIRTAVEGLVSLLQVDPLLHAELRRASLLGRNHPAFREFEERLEVKSAELFELRGSELPTPPVDSKLSAEVMVRMVGGAIEATLISDPQRLQEREYIDELVRFVEARFGLVT